MENPETDNINVKIAGIVGLCAQYCALIENARELEKEDFVTQVTSLIPQIYWNFSDIVPDAEWMEEAYFPEYVTEDYYDSIRMRLATLLGEDDTYLDTFEEDMKFSDTPIAASISEHLADIFQSLYNFVESVRTTDGNLLSEAYVDCRADFVTYWSNTLCSVMRPLNQLRFRNANN